MVKDIILQFPLPQDTRTDSDLRQNSLRRIPLGRKLRQSLLNFCACPALPYCRPLFSVHRFTSAQIVLLEPVR